MKEASADNQPASKLSEQEESGEGFDEIVKYTLPGFLAAFVVGAVLDFFGFHTSAVGQWLVRTLSGAGESVFEGIYAIRQRMRGASGSMAEAYGWGKLFGMGPPWIIDAVSRLAGIDVYGVESFYIPYFYALSDQIGANLSGLLFLLKKHDSRRSALRAYFHHPVMLTSLAIILIVPLGLLAVRMLGFSPTTQKYTALETIAANLCWLPPVVGWLGGKYISKKR